MRPKYPILFDADEGAGGGTEEQAGTEERELSGAAGASAAKKARKERDDAKRELADLRARFKKIEDAEKSETERLRSELDEIKSDREREQAQAAAEREERSKRDIVRRAAGEFADPEDAIAHLSLRDELATIDDEADAKRALKQLAKDKPYLLKQQPGPGGPLDAVLQGGLPPGQQELNKALGDPTAPKTGEQMYAMDDADFLAWRKNFPDAYKRSVEGWTGQETIGSLTAPAVAVKQ